MPRELLVQDNELYGVAQRGGSLGNGAVFAVNTSGGGKTIYDLRNASKPIAGLTILDGELFGPALNGGTHDNGVIFGLSLTSYSRNYTFSFVGHDTGDNPSTKILTYNGSFYGTTSAGGTRNLGIVYAVDPKTGVERVLHSFAGGLDASRPYNDFVLLSGEIYGTSSNGGSSGCGGIGCGTIFKVNPSTGVQKVVVHFLGGSYGFEPSSGLVALGGKLYGVTVYGGNAGDGTLYQFDVSTGREVVLHNFAPRSQADGYYPIGNLAIMNGVLYGTTYSGGSGGDGTVFQYNMVTHQLSTLYSFQGGADGIDPQTGVIAYNGTLYGVANGGLNQRGIVYSATTSGKETILYSF